MRYIALRNTLKIIIGRRKQAVTNPVTANSDRCVLCLLNCVRMNDQQAIFVIVASFVKDLEQNFQNAR